MNTKRAVLLFIILIGFYLFIVFLIWFFYDYYRQENDENVLGEKQQQQVTENTATPSATVANKFVVTKVIDGDTIEVDFGGQTFPVRLIGVDTPETVAPGKGKECFGSEASDETKKLLLNKEIMLEEDRENKDRYDRFLRYVYLKLEDGNFLFVNDYLVREGFGSVLMISPNTKFKERFTQAESQAKQANKGLWGKCSN